MKGNEYTYKGMKGTDRFALGGVWFEVGQEVEFDFAPLGTIRLRIDHFASRKPGPFPYIAVCTRRDGGQDGAYSFHDSDVVRGRVRLMV